MRLGIFLLLICASALLSPTAPQRRDGFIQTFEDEVEKAADIVRTLATKSEELLQDVGSLLTDYEASVIARVNCEKPDEYSFVLATVQESPLSHEQTFLEKRKARALIKFNKLCHKTITADELPVISFCASGGGTRAMLETIGWLTGAESIGILDIVQYASGLSGSTWALNPWALSGLSLKEYAHCIVPRLTKPLSVHLEEMTSKDRSDLLLMLARTYYNNGTIDFVHLYGGLLAHLFLKDVTNIDKPFDIGLSILQKNIISGDYPFIVSTSVVGARPEISDIFGHKPSFEFTPLYSGSFELGNFVPTWAVGRPFFEGSCQALVPKSLFPELAAFNQSLETLTPEYAQYVIALEHMLSFVQEHGYYGHEVPISYLLGICGSAFAVDVYDIVLQLYDMIQPSEIGPSEKEAVEIFIKIIQNAIENELAKLGEYFSSGKLSKDEIIQYFQNHQLAAAQISNPSFGMSDSVVKDIQHLSLVDAGLDAIDLDLLNIAIIPLLYRKSDVIFICDSSANITRAPSLRAAEALAYKLGLPFPSIAYDHIDTNHASLFYDELQPMSPIIVYMPCISNPSYDKHRGRSINPHDPAFCAQNFTYTTEQSNDLMGLIAYNVEQNKDILLEAVTLAATRKASTLASLSA